MKLSFTKMHGCGNDYVYFNGFEQPIENPEALSILLSDRHKGVGGDGIILINPSDVADAQMRIFNIDGSEGMMCGNGIRCVGKYLYDHGTKKKLMKIESKSGIKTLHLTVDADDNVAQITVEMGAAIWQPDLIPVQYEGARMVDQTITVQGVDYKATAVSMGNPHCVIFCDEVETLDLEKMGPHFECMPIFPERVNTEFVKVIGKNHLQMRVWERGSGETFACGTGTCAVVAAACANGICAMDEDVTVDLRGGTLVIRVTEEEVYMTGEAVTVFDGVIELA